MVKVKLKNEEQDSEFLESDELVDWEKGNYMRGNVNKADNM
jgi:hypothetical protein